MSGNYPASNEDDPIKLARSIRDLYEGRSNATGSFTCATGAAQTTVTAKNCSPVSKVMLTPTTANGAAEYGAGTCYVSSKAQGSFIVKHANSATTLRTFDYAIQG